MTPSLTELIRRDLDALDADLAALRGKIDGVRAAVASNDLHVVPHRAAVAEEVAHCIRERLHEIGLQISNRSHA